MRYLRLLTLTAGITLGLGASAWAGPPTEQLRAYTDQVIKVLDKPTLTASQRLEAVRKVADEAFDVRETARRVLGLHWQRRTPAEQEEFVQLFRNLLEQTYLSRISEYGGERIKYTSERVEGARATVWALILSKKGTEVSVESRLLQKADRWLIYDVLIENISLIGSYRSQFDRIIRTASYEELIRRLKSRGNS